MFTLRPIPFPAPVMTIIFPAWLFAGDVGSILG